MGKIDHTTAESKVSIEQTRLLYQQGFVTQILGLITALVTVSMFYGVIDSRYLFLWLALVFLLSSVRIYSSYRFNKLPIDGSVVEMWKNRYIFETFLSGVLWGSLSFFYDPATWPISHQIILFAIFTGLAAGSFNTNSAVLYAFPAFFIPVTLSIFYMALLGFQDSLFEFFSLLLIYIIIMGSSSTRYYQRLKETLELRFSNEELAKELSASNLKLKELTEIDELTQIYNRRIMNRYLTKSWKHMLLEKKTLSLLLIDIDYFKQYNDTYGHDEGDKCLVTVAKLLQETIEDSSSIVARMGGEEFAVILPDTSSNVATMMAEKIQNKLLSQAIPHEGSTVSSKLTLSFGIATIVPTEDQSENVLFKSADEALYQAKKEGRNRIVTIDLHD